MDTSFVNISKILDKIYPVTFLAESPIEKKLAYVLLKFGIEVEPQKQIGPYRADIFIKSKYRNIVVECDGKEFHKDKVKDGKRDAFMEAQGILVLRFTGSQINRSAEACAVKIIENISEIYSTQKFQDFLQEKLKETENDIYQEDYIED